jgi:hypothetical protein
MHRISGGLLLTAVFVCSSGLGGTVFTGQIQAQLQLPTTVQLPVFRNFFYSGAVKVPDGGTISLGGVTRSAEGAAAGGVPGLSNLPVAGRGFGNRGIGREQEAGNLTTTAQILIQEELEAQHLARAGLVPAAEAENADVLRKAAFLSKHTGRNVDWQPPPQPDRRRDSWNTGRHPDRR